MTTTPATGLAAMCVAMLSLGWNIRAWRRSGPSIRVRALLSGTTLRLTIANRGRSPDTVAHVFLGGPTVGSGKDITENLESAPMKIDASSHLQHDIRLDSVADAQLIGRAQQGFESVFVCLGSLRSIRVDVLPCGQLTPASSWLLNHQSGRIRRYAPVASAMVAVAASASTPNSASTTVLAVVLIALICSAVWCASAIRRQQFARARIERWLTAAGLFAALFLGVTTHSRAHVLTDARLSDALAGSVRNSV